METISFEVKARTAWITLDRPRQFNSISQQMLEELSGVLDRIESEAEVGAAVITGRRRFFCAGADVGEISRIDDPVEATKFSRNAQELFGRIERTPKPLVAAINGPALGGGLELALACDLRVASDRAKLGLPEIKLGIMPGAGGTVRLPRVVGAGHALDLMLTGEPISAEAAHRIGLVNRLVPADQLETEAQGLAALLASRPPLALAAIRRSVIEGGSMCSEAAMKLEAEMFGGLFGSDDQKEGLAAFSEKRPPRFQGK